MNNAGWGHDKYAMQMASESIDVDSGLGSIGPVRSRQEWRAARYRTSGPRTADSNRSLQTKVDVYNTRHFFYTLATRARILATT